MKKQKTPAENFSFKVSGLVVSVEPEKFIRPDLSRTGVQYYGLVTRKYESNISRLYLSDYKITSMVACRGYFVRYSNVKVFERLRLTTVLT